MCNTRLLVAVSLAVLLSTVLLRGGNHFGFPIAVFSYDTHPSEPLEQLAAGDLGIIRPGYARSYLYASYRWIEGAPMSAEEQRILSHYWRVKLKLIEQEEPSDDGGWFELRESLDLPPPPEPRGRNPTYALSPRNFVLYMPCGGNAFAVAADRLRDHIDRFGRDSREVRSWVSAQDSAFLACGQGVADGAIPGAAPSDVDPEIQRDRAYQSAATYFNGGKFAEAEKRFRAIPADPSYPGGLWAPYMVGRSILWQARFERDDGEYRSLLRKARFELQNVLQDDKLEATHDAARYLLIRILTAVDPEPGTRLLGIRLVSPLRVASRLQDLRQYFELLDAALYAPNSRIATRQLANLGRQDDLTDWILTFQGWGDDDRTHAIERWRQSGSTAWLIAALEHASPDDAAAPELLEAAAALGRSPGWASVQYYRAKLLLAAGRRQEARNVLDSLIPALAARPSSANRAHALRTEASEDFAEALRYGIAEPVSFGEMTSGGEKTQPWKWKQWAEGWYGSQTVRAMVTPALARILNSSVPLDRFARLVSGDAPLPEAVRREMLLTAWIRAVLLERWDLAAPLAAECAREIPETASYMTRVAVAEPGSRDLLVKLALLRFPGIGVQIRSGIGRDAPLEQIQRDGLNWWWWQDGYGVGLGGSPESIALDWITVAERAQAKREWERIVALGEGHDWIYAGVLSTCDRPNPPAACEEALYRAGMSYAAVGYWHDPAWLELEVKGLDDRVLPILNRRFPRSTWTEGFAAGAEQMKRSGYSDDTTFRRVVPYPR